MQRIWICFFIICGFICCNNDSANNNAVNSQNDSVNTSTNDNVGTDSSASTQEPADVDKSPATSKCYAYTQNGDTIRLSIVIKGSKFTGSLLYQLKEKDRNRGTVAGSIKGDTLLADYTFNAEGMQSVRQVAFLKQGNDLKEGFGEIKEENGKMVFKNPGQLNFTGFLLTSTACN